MTNHRIYTTSVASVYPHYINKAEKKGKNLVLTVGYSHQVTYPEPAGITLTAQTPTVVVIEGIDKQADGGTHVKATGEVGHVTVVKTESKGKAFKRMRIQLEA